MGTLDREREAALADLTQAGSHRRQERAPLVMVLAGLVLFAFGAGFSNAEFGSGSERSTTTGTVVELLPDENDPGMSGMLVEYTVAGQAYRFVPDFAQRPAPRLGSSVEVRYAVEDPADARLGGWYRHFPVAFAAFGLLVAALAVWMWRRATSGRRRAARAIRGIRLEATVDGVHRRMGAGVGRAWFLTLHREDPRTGAIEEFEHTVHGNSATEEPQVGDVLPVFVDSGDSSNYVVLA